MSQIFLNILAVSGVFALCSIILGAVGGSAIQVLGISVPREIQITVALGLGTVIVSLTAAIAYRIGLPVDWSIYVVVVGAAFFNLYQFSSYLIMIRNSSNQFRKLDRERFYHCQDFVRSRSSSIIAVVASFALMLPVTRFGLTSWTLGTNDFPNYVSSVVVWLDGQEAFKSQQYGGFEEKMLERAGNEKIIATGFLAFLTKSSGLSPHQLLSVYVWIPLLLLLASLFAIHSLVSRAQKPQHLAAIIAVAGSSVPMSRLYDAQPGQVLMVALTSLGILLFLASNSSKTDCSNSQSLPYVAGVTFATALGANPTLFVGVAPTVFAFLAWLLVLKIRHKRWWGEFQIWRASLFAFVLTATPFISYFVWSFRKQTSGLAGFDIPLILPTALFGLQPNYANTFGLLPTLIFWALATTTILMLFKIRRIGGFSSNIWFLGVTVALNFSFFAVVYGSNAYTTAKYLAVILALVAPILVAKFLDLVLTGEFLPASVPAVLLTLSLTFTLAANVKSLPPQLWPKLQELLSQNQAVNVMAAPHSPSALIATSLPKVAQIRIVQQTISKASIPNIQAPFIVDSTTLDTGKFIVKEELAPGYFLADLIPPRFQDKIFFSTNSPDSNKYLWGEWSMIEDWGIWSTGPQAIVLVLLPKDKISEDLEVTIYADLYTPEKEFNSLRITIGDGLQERKFSTKDLSISPIRLLLTVDEIQTLGHVLQITLQASHFISPSEHGSLDERKLGVALKGIEFKWK
jgi:hypothetical protein